MDFLNKAIMLINLFINSEITADIFEDQYIDLWREGRDSGEMDIINEETDSAPDKLFTAVDVYCTDFELIKDYSIDEDELIEVAKQTLNTLMTTYNIDKMRGDIS